MVVTTDDDEIATISKEHGASIPFIRDKKLADDFTTTAVVLFDALEQLPKSNHACCLYPTAPLLDVSDLQQAYAKLLDRKADCIISITEFDFHPLRAFETGPDERLDFKWPEHALTRSQDLPELMHDAGAFYFFDTKAFQEHRKLVMENTIGYPIERSRAVDIDTLEDFELAKVLHENWLKRKTNAVR